MLNFKIYLSDEEYGHIVRQRATFKKLNKFQENQLILLYKLITI